MMSLSDWRWWPEMVVGACLSVCGVARAAMWWIDRDMARRAVPAHQLEFHASEHPGSTSVVVYLSTSVVVSP